MRAVPLSGGLGEVMAPGTLVTALILSPDGTVTVDPGALHGRSAAEGSVSTWVKRPEDVAGGETYWLVWVAVELDEAQQPVRYRGTTACELLVNRAAKTGYKSLATQVNRMTEAMQGRVSLDNLPAPARVRLRAELVRLHPQAWERAGKGFAAAWGPLTV